MQLLQFIKNNLLFKITTVNAVVISIRLVITLAIQNILSRLIGEAGIAKVGQLRNVLNILNNITTFGVFSGVVKYTSQFKDDKKGLQKLFSTSFVFTVFGSILSALGIYFLAPFLSSTLFNSPNFEYLFRLLAIIVPCIAINRLFTAIINGLSDYKKFAKIDLISYLISAALLLFGLYNYQLNGVLIAIAITPLIQLSILLFIFFKTLKQYVKFKKLNFAIPYKNELFAFTVMSFVSTFLLNYIEIDIRSSITAKINEDQAGIWTAMTNISKNYMVFSSGIFSMYVLPKFANIVAYKDFKNEVLHIYKTILPLFAIGMLLIYVFRDLVIFMVYPDFLDMKPLFKWQLIGDFFRLAAMILAHQFLAKKMVKNFIVSELFSLLLFFGLAKYLVTILQVEGVVIAHCIRSILCLFFVLFLVNRYFAKTNKTPNDTII